MAGQNRPHIGEIRF